MRKPIYLDYAASTPVDERVVKSIVQSLSSQDSYGNPSSIENDFGKKAADEIDYARHQVADLLNCKAKEIIFTSGATESDNLSVKGAAFGAEVENPHVISLSTEHKAILSAGSALNTAGIETTIIDVDETGMLDIEKLTQAIRPTTALVSVMHVNNETGVIQDIERIGEILARHNCLFHIDAAQSAGKLEIDLENLQVDLLSISGHKVYGPKGIGALYVRTGVEKKLQPILDGGGQELGLRPGTLPTHQIIGLGAALEIAKESRLTDQKHISDISQRFIQAISKIQDVVINGDRQNAIPNIVNASFLGVDAEALINRIPEMAVSSSSACTAGAVDPSYVLRAMGIEDDRLYGAVRFSFGRSTNIEEIDFVNKKINEEVSAIRSL